MTQASLYEEEHLYLLLMEKKTQTLVSSKLESMTCINLFHMHFFCCLDQN